MPGPSSTQTIVAIGHKMGGAVLAFLTMLVWALPQVLGAIAGGIAIFLPGLLLIYFIYPIWENLKKIKGIKVSLKGITAVAGGLITIAAVILMENSHHW